jgi:hypothetical protein
MRYCLIIDENFVFVCAENVVVRELEKKLTANLSYMKINSVKNKNSNSQKLEKLSKIKFKFKLIK